MTIHDIKIHVPKEIINLDNLVKACLNAENADFKALWLHKLIDLAKKYNLMDYVTNKITKRERILN